MIFTKRKIIHVFVAAIISLVVTHERHFVAKLRKLLDVSVMTIRYTLLVMIYI